MTLEGTITSSPTYSNMHDQIHIDEMVLYICLKHVKNIISFRMRSSPCKSKMFITKIMFLAAVARPRFDYTTNKEFNGKSGI